LLAQVIDYYDDPDKVVPNAINRDPLLAKPLKLTNQEKLNLESFLRSLTDKRFLTAKGPQKSQPNDQQNLPSSIIFPIGGPLTPKVVQPAPNLIRIHCVKPDYCLLLSNDVCPCPHSLFSPASVTRQFG
jgi:hypothetical protein